MSFIHKAIRKSYHPAPRRGINTPIDTFSIRLHSGGDVIDGLTVDGGVDGPRDVSMLSPSDRRGAFGCLISPGGVHFITRQGKKWFIKFNEFSFVFLPEAA